MIDREGYRHGVGIIIVNSKRQLFLAKRIGKPAWQFPQGGMLENELPIDAMYRELYEEIGLKKEHVELLAETKSWLRYKLPKKLIRYNSKPLCFGQKQKWFLLKIKSDTLKFDLLASHSPEFDSWAWVSYWYPLTQVIAFKKRVYNSALKEFAHIVLSKKFWDYF